MNNLNFKILILLACSFPSLALADTIRHGEVMRCTYEPQFPATDIGTLVTDDEASIKHLLETFPHAVCRTLNDNRHNWHLFIQTNNGLVSLKHDLTERVCNMVLLKADSHHYNADSSWTVQGGDFKQGECFE